MPRPTLYYQLERLQERGLISQTLKRGVKTFFAEPPQKINLLFQQRIADLQAQQNAFRDVLPLLEEKHASRLLRPKFRLYEGLEGMQQVLLDVLLYANTEYLCFWPPKEMVEVLSREFFYKHNRERIRINSSIRVIWPKENVIDLSHHPFLGAGAGFKREVRLAPVEYKMGYWVYGNKVAFLSSVKECFGFTIESEELAQVQRAQFELLWQQAIPFNGENEATKAYLEEINIKDL